MQDLFQELGGSNVIFVLTQEDDDYGLEEMELYEKLTDGYENPTIGDLPEKLENR